jgi:hypothetical protein
VPASDSKMNHHKQLGQERGNLYLPHQGNKYIIDNAEPLIDLEYADMAFLAAETSNAVSFSKSRMLEQYIDAERKRL